MCGRGEEPRGRNDVSEGSYGYGYGEEERNEEGEREQQQVQKCGGARREWSRRS